MSLGGGSIEVGEWRSGAVAKWETRASYPATGRSLQGRYKTEALLPGQVVVSMIYFHDSALLEIESFRLPTASEWKRFSLPVEPRARANNVKISLGLLEPTDGSVAFADVVLSDQSATRTPTSPVQRDQHQFENASASGEFTSLSDGEGDTSEHAFPDPFDPRWEQSLRRSIAEKTSGAFTAWVAGDGLEHQDIHRYLYSRYCAQAFREWLENKYLGINLMNVVWTSRYESFEALFQIKPDPEVRSGPMYDDFREFSREVIRRYNETVIRVIREFDPKRPIYSNRFTTAELRDWVDNLDLYSPLDGIALRLDEPAENWQMELLELVKQRSGKPVIVSRN